MSKELVISANRHETRVALLEDDQLVEVYFQRANEYSLAGSIHKGRVTRVLPGMQSAFVDLGLERDTFLYVSDFLEEHEDFDRVGDEAPRRDGGRGRERGERDRGRDRDRGERRPPPPPVAAAAPVEAAEPAAVEGEAPAAATDAGPAAPAATGERSERSNGGERFDRGRGRRGRRRRGGRAGDNRPRQGGIPESKYAEPTDVVETEAEEETASEVEVIEADAPVEPILLPGESLAKYRRPASNPAAPKPTVIEVDPMAEDAPEPVAEVVAEDTTEFDEPVHFPRENVMPDAPEHPVAAVEAEAADAVESVEEEEAEDEDVDEEVAAEERVGHAFLDEDEDRDIQEMILGAVEDAIEPPADEAEAEEEGDDEPVGEVVPAEGEPAAAEAQVREQGGRYPHRMSSRRRRGRGRGGERGERGEQRGERPNSERSERPNSERSERPNAESERSERSNEERTVSAQTRAVPSISELLKEGQEIIVQIAKEPLGQKGARITSHVALPGRFVVYMPTLEHMGVSRKIGSDDERQRLKRILQSRRPGTVGGFITRTAAEGRTEEEIAGDMEFLYNLWQDIRAKADKRRAPVLLHHDLDIVQRILRDQLSDDFKAIWIDSEEMFESILRFVERFQPALVGKVKMYTREAPIFDAFGVTQELEKALRPKVWLKSGGYIVINQTEALVAIDVNTGKFVGKSNRLEDTIVKTNTEAIKEIVRQVRLRDLGGIIVIDFIDMDERKNRQKVMAVLEETMRADRAPYKILQFNDFGLVAITRKRVKQSLERTLCSPCPHCEGAGYVKSVQTVVSEILTEARKMASTVEGKDVMLRVHPDVAKLIKSHNNKYLEELEETLRRPVLVKSDPQLHHEKFDLA